MTLCQLTDQMLEDIKSKLEEIQQRVNVVVESIDERERCLLCEITVISELARELQTLASFYHFHSSLVPHVEGLDEISKALTNLSEKGHGALVAVELEDSLESYINACTVTGVAIGAEVSAPLLEAIFYPGNPLHDGAVIIKGRRIVSAGCLLPLSEKKYTEEGKKLGTRHRAALGLSEKTDALVLVVSEETGQVSYAKGGVLYPIEVKLCSYSESVLGKLKPNPNPNPNPDPNPNPNPDPAVVNKI